MIFLVVGAVVVGLLWGWWFWLLSGAVLRVVDGPDAVCTSDAAERRQ